jgi:hypothetical protein
VIFEGDHLLCAICGEGVETKNHLFFLCHLAWSIWSRGIGGLVWLRLSRDQFRLFLKDFYLPLIVERNSLTGYWWFDMRLFEFFGELEMIKSFLTKLLILRTYWKELSVSLGSGCWRRNQIHIVCIMSGLYS